MTFYEYRQPARLVSRERRARAADVNGKLRLAAIGTGGKGQDDLQNISASPRVEVVALCNVDDSQPHLGWAAEKFPKAKRFRDYRKLLDEANAFDAVSVSTPDFMHAPIALAAMSLGKHVFCQKPLAHSVHEIRLMEDSAKRHKLVTQMGNQIQSHHAYRDAVQMVHDGAIGKVREVHSWQAGDMRLAHHTNAAEGFRSSSGVAQVGFVVGCGPGAAVQEKFVPSAELACVAGFQHGAVGRFWLSYSRPRVHGFGSYGSDDHRGRCATVEQRYVVAPFEGGIPIPGHRSDRRRIDHGHLV